MSTNKIVHFVYFETVLDPEQFIGKWEHYLRSENSDVNVTLQQSKKNKLYKYIAEHRCTSEEFEFTFKRAAKTTRSKEVEIRTKHLGGYLILQEEHNDDAKADESKLFVFLNYSNKDFSPYKQLQFPIKLNIYEAYYENCTYAYILEYFVKSKHVEQLNDQLQQYNAVAVEIYKECNLKTV
jgi:hypothetical protein